ncbi:MAG: DUF2207 family protein [Candidatus Thorarchaeota archaeon]
MYSKKKKILSIMVISLFLISNIGILIFSIQNTLAYDSSKDSYPEITAYTYSKWDQNITIGMDGSLLVQELMTFDLDPGSYGYAYRNLKWKGFHDVDSWSIQSVGIDTPPVYYYNIERTVEQIEFYWEFTRYYYSSNVELTFLLTYNVSRAMDLRGARDRVYWNVIGGEFEVDIFNIDTRVIFPNEYNLNDIRSTTYYLGSNPGDDEGNAVNIDGKTHVLFHQNVVRAYESYTIDADSPPAGIDMEFSWRRYLNDNWIICIALGFVPVFLFFILLFLFKGMDPRVRIIPTLNEVQVKKCNQCGYQDNRQVKFCPLCGGEIASINEIGPPNDLTPAEVGTLLDEKFDKIDFVAEFFYLAEKGYLKIIQTDDSSEIYFQRTQKAAYYGELSNFDKSILSFIEGYSHDTIWFKDESEKAEQIPVEVISLSTIKLKAHILWGHKTDVYHKLSGGDTPYFEVNPDKIRNKYSTLAFLIGVILGIGAFFLTSLVLVNNLKYSIVGIVIACFIGLILARKMPKLTKYGAQMKASWNGYLQMIRGQMLGFPDPYEQFSFSMNHFSFLLIDPKFNLPNHLKYISKKVAKSSPPSDYYYTAPYWYYYPGIYYPLHGGVSHRTITGFDSMGKGFESMVRGISNLAENLPSAIANMADGLTHAISNMAEGFTPPSSSGGGSSSSFGGGFSGGGGGGGGGGIG